MEEEQKKRRKRRGIIGKGKYCFGEEKKNGRGKGGKISLQRENCCRLEDGNQRLYKMQTYKDGNVYSNAQQDLSPSNCLRQKAPVTYF